MEGEGELTLNEAQEERLRGCFDQFDKDGSGQLNCSELEEAMQLLGLNPSRQDVKEIMAKYDVDGDRSLSYEEFRPIMVQELNKAMREMRKGFVEAFREFDKDGSGKLDKEEFRNAVTNNGDNKMTDEEVDDLFEAIDVDDDGKINCEEMIALFMAVFEAFMDQQEGQGSQHGSRPGSQQKDD